ncbi:MAG: DUF1501 domain-containing protein [Chryseolinea sp.]
MTTRRQFIQKSLLGTAGTLLVPGFLKAFEKSAMATKGNKKLVIIQLSGGNDGLNTIVPYRNDLYYRARPTLAISKESVLKASDDLGFHPALANLNALYDKGYVSVLNNVGYPNPDRSHFRSMDIWQTASASNDYLDTGWVGRFLDSSCQSCATHKAIEIDDTLSLAMKGETIKGMAMKNPDKLYKGLRGNLFHEISSANSAQDINDPALHYLYKTMAETISSAELIHEKSNVARSRGVYPEGEFSARLKTVSELIKADLDTSVYYVSLSGFDTHVNQINQHQRLLATYADGVNAFVNDLGDTIMKEVLILTFSEFGRRVSQNASGGTDHGTANNVFLISGDLKKKGFLNETPDLSSLDEGDLIHRVDFRSVYATILDKWLEVPSQKILKSSFNTLSFI